MSDKLVELAIESLVVIVGVVAVTAIVVLIWARTGETHSCGAYEKCLDEGFSPGECKSAFLSSGG